MSIKEDIKVVEELTYKQPDGTIIKLRRLKGEYDGYERLVHGQRQEWGTCIGNHWLRRRMLEWQFFEEDIGSKLLKS